MLAVVLVGGYGTRLRPLTNDVPKPMLPVANRPMIVRLAEQLAAGGVTDVVLALGFKPEPFAEAFPEGVLDSPHGRVRIHFAVEPEPLDTGGAIAFAARHIGVDAPFVVANGDVITDLSVARLVDAHRSGGCLATIHLTRVDDPSTFGVVECDENGVVQRFVEKPPPGTTTSDLINAGTYVLDPAVLDLIPEGRRVSIERDTFPQLVDRGQLGTLYTDDYWIDTGKPEHLLVANLDLVNGSRGEPELAVAAGAEVDPGSFIDGSVIGTKAVVAPGATVVGSVLLPGAHVGSGARVHDSIIAGHVGTGAVLRGCVVGATYAVPAGAELSGEKLPSPE